MPKLRLIPVFFCLAALARAAVAPAAFPAAVELFNQRKTADAQSAFEALAAAEPRNAEVQSYLGRLALRRGDTGQAVTALEKAVALAPADSEYFRLLANAYGNSAQKAGLLAKMGFAGKFVAAINRSIALDPANVAARFGLLEFARQAPAIVGGGMDKAYAQAAEIQKLDPVQGHRAYASLYDAEKRYREALEACEAVLRDAPDDYGALYQTGRLAAISGAQPDRGLECLRRCLELTPPENSPGRAPTHWRIGNILERKGDKAAARAAYEASLQADPGFAEAATALKKL